MTNRGTERTPRADRRALGPADSDYPARLRDLADAPDPVYLEGAWNFRGPVVAIVGSRQAESYERELAYHLASALAAAGIAIVSGLAVGIDAAAHEGTLDAGGSSGAVLGTDLDDAVPARSRSLRERLRRSLGLMSEVPPGGTRRGTFASRNRIIAALADAVILVRGDATSGALLTVGAAERLGRAVGAVPGDPRDVLAAAPNRLIHDGRARLVRHGGDVLDLLGVRPNVNERSAPSRSTERRVPGDRGAPGAPGAGSAGIDAGLAGRVLAGLRSRPEPLDVVATRIELPAAETSAALLDLELRGLARREPGGRYRRARGA